MSVQRHEGSGCRARNSGNGVSNDRAECSIDIGRVGNWSGVHWVGGVGLEVVERVVVGVHGEGVSDGSGAEHDVVLGSFECRYGRWRGLVEGYC